MLAHSLAWGSEANAIEGSLLGALTSKYDPMAACKFLEKHVVYNAVINKLQQQLPIVHIEKKCSRGIIKLGAEQLLQLLHELVPVGRAHAAELLQKRLFDVHVAVVGCGVRFNVIHVHRGHFNKNFLQLSH